MTESSGERERRIVAEGMRQRDQRHRDAKSRRPPTISTIVCQGEHAVLVLHSCVFGRSERNMRRFRVRKEKPSAQHAVAVHIDLVEPRKRRWMGTTIEPTNHRYATIERDGGVLYDSRSDVPIDMRAWEKRHAESVGRAVAGGYASDRDE
jgi:hypothetical protein